MSEETNADVQNSSNSGIGCIHDSKTQGVINRSVSQGENSTVPFTTDTIWWGANLTNFTGCVQVTAPGGNPLGNSQLMTVTSDTAPEPSTPPDPSAPMALIVNNAGSGVQWAYSDNTGSFAGPLDDDGAFQAVPYSQQTIWYGVYLSGFTGYIEVVGPGGSVNQGYKSQINVEYPDQTDDDKRAHKNQGKH
ncbi:MAG TPA: hypothetical protein VNN25_18360 [Thermoanaerobaculia bacterium]|nr:hypothetical protein [Thermoanaerobaculia bacterium]